MSEPFAESMEQPRRVVEASFRLPKAEEITFPKVDLEPVAEIGRELLLTTVGIGVLAAQGLAAAARAAYQAGLDEASKPDSWLHSILKAATDAPAAQQEQGVPVLPIADYDRLDEQEVVARLDGLTRDELDLVRRYEAANLDRVIVLDAIARRLG